MPVFLLEAYLPGSGDALEQAAESARDAAELAAREGVAVRYLQTTLVPADETCLHLFEASSLAVIEAVAARAGLACDRIVEALSPHGRGPASP
jgi:hypothetical protein